MILWKIKLAEIVYEDIIGTLAIARLYKPQKVS